MNGDNVSPFSDKQVHLVHPVTPQFVLTLSFKHHATQMQGALAEYMNLMVRAVADGLHMVVTPTDCDGADLFDDGLD